MPVISRSTSPVPGSVGDETGNLMMGDLGDEQPAIIRVTTNESHDFDTDVADVGKDYGWDRDIKSFAVASIASTEKQRMNEFNFFEKNCAFLDRYCFKEVFWQPIGCLLFGIIVMSILLVTWWYSRAKMQIDDAMDLTAQSIEQIYLYDLETAFGMSQTILQLMIGAIYVGDISMEISANENDQTYEFLSSLPQHDIYEAVETVFIYHVNSNILKGATVGTYMGGNAVFTYNSSCLVTDYVNNNSSNSKGGNFAVDCGYDPKSRPWYNFSQFLTTAENGYSTREWTDVYVFSSNFGLGMSLVENVQINNDRYVVVVDFTIASLQRASARLNIPLDGILYICNEKLSVITSSIGQIDLVDCQNTYKNNSCTATNELISGSLVQFREMKQDGILNSTNTDSRHHITFGSGNVATITQFSVAWTFGGSQHFYLILTYSDAYLDDIHWAIRSSIIYCAVFVVCGSLLLICIQCADVSLRASKIVPKTKFKGFESNIKKNMDKIKLTLIEFLASLKNDLSRIHTMTKISKILLVLGSIAMYTIVNYAKDKSYSRLIEETLVKEEFNQIYAPMTYLIFRHAEITLDVLAQRFNMNKMPGYDFPFRGIEDTVLEAYNDNNDHNTSFNFNYSYGDSIDKYFSNLMLSFTSSNNYFKQDAIWMGLANGSFYGAQAANISYPREQVELYAQDATTNWHYSLFTATDDGYRDELIEESDWYDARCRDWYFYAIKYTFSGNARQAFPIDENDLNSLWYGDYTTNVECVDAIGKYHQLFGIEPDKNDSTDSSTIFSRFVEAKKTLTKQIDGLWTRYLFTHGAVGISFSKAVTNKSTGDLLGVVAMDYTLEGVSKLIAASNDENDWIGWIFEANDTSMIASSDEQVLRSVGGLEGLSCLSDDASTELIPYQVLEHPNEWISLLTKIIIDAGINLLPVNITNSELLSKSVEVILGAPYVEAARLTYWPGIIGDDLGVDYIIVKAIDLSSLENSMDDSRVIVFIVATTMLLICLYAIDRRQRWIAHQLKQKSLTEIDWTYNVCQESKTSLVRTIYDMKDDLQAMITDRASVEWDKQLRSYDSKHVITMQDVKEFTSSKAKIYLKIIDNLNTSLDKMQIFDEAIMIIDKSVNDNIFMLIFKIMASNWYNFVCESIIVLHIMTLFFIPDTEEKLEKQGWPQWLTISVAMFIMIEWIDLGLQFFSRWTRCAVRCNANKYITECQRLQSNDATTAQSTEHSGGDNAIAEGIRYVYNEETIDDLTFFWRTTSNIARVFFGPGSKVCILYTVYL